jgi:hypothetical protein
MAVLLSVLAAVGVFVGYILLMVMLSSDHPWARRTTSGLGILLLIAIVVGVIIDPSILLRDSVVEAVAVIGFAALIAAAIWIWRKWQAVELAYWRWSVRRRARNRSRGLPETRGQETMADHSRRTRKPADQAVMTSRPPVLHVDNGEKPFSFEELAAQGVDLSTLHFEDETGADVWPTEAKPQPPIPLPPSP